MEKEALDWNDMQFLLVVANSSSMYEAAESLQVNRTTISRKVDALEDALGVKLLTRDGRGLKLTESGEQAVQTAQIIRSEMLNLKRRVSGRDEMVSGHVRFTSAPKIAMLIEPELSRFSEQHPELVLEVSATMEKEDLDLLESDVALRLTNEPPEQLIGRKLAEPASALYASKEFAKTFPCSGEVNYIQSGRFVDIRQWMHENLALEPKVVLSTNSTDLVAQFVQSGRGVAYLPCYVGEYQRGLVRVSDIRRAGMPDLWLLYHPRQKSLRRVRALADVVTAACQRLKPIIEGEVLSNQTEFGDLSY